MGNYDFESKITIAVLVVLIGVYIYLLLSPTQPRLNAVDHNFVIKRDTLERFQAFIGPAVPDTAGGFSSNSWDKSSFRDDFSQFADDPFNEKDTGLHPAQEVRDDDDFMLMGHRDQMGDMGGGIEEGSFQQHQTAEPIVPSEDYTCGEGFWMVARSEMNYKFLWMHQNANWMSATGTLDTPLHHKAFKLHPVSSGCTEGGWVLLQEGDSKGFIRMIKPDDSQSEAWVVKIDSDDVQVALNDTTYHFLLEKDASNPSNGYILNRGNMAFINVMADSDYTVRGHSAGWDRSQPAGREFGAYLKLDFVDAAQVTAAVEHEVEEEKEAAEQDAKCLEEIKSFPASNEKRVISFGLYGSNPKYTTGAIRNAELAKVYFPGWVCRFYVTQDVPKAEISQLVALGSEIENIPPGKGYTSGMFWRFRVAADPTVDRYIIRDVDSRLNARDRLAVEDWIESKYPVHTMRDHMNHCLVMNGGMWGGTKTAIEHMNEKIDAWQDRDQYLADMNFLEQQIWPDVKDKQIAHDSYCCDRFPNARPFPSQRPVTYQHVGQVFDQFDKPRLNDIDSFIRGVPVPGSCRKHADWIYG